MLMIPLEKGNEVLTTPASEKKQSSGLWWREGVMMFAEATGWIVVPLIAALYLGRYLDEQQGTGNVYFLSLTAFGFIISSIGIGLIGAKYIKRVERERKTTKKNDKGNAIA